MRLAVITACYPPMHAAEADYAYLFCHGMAQRGYHVDAYTARDGVIVEQGKVETVPVGEHWNWSEMPGILRQVRSRGADAVALLYLGWPYGDGHPMATFLPGIIRRSGFEGPIVTLFYNRYGAERSKASWITKLVQRGFEKVFGSEKMMFEYGTTVTHSDHVFVLNQSQADWIGSIFPEHARKIEVLPSLPLLKMSPLLRDKAMRRTRERFQIASEESLLVFFGYVYRGKGLETLIEALARTSPKIKALVLGGTLARSNPADFGEPYRAELQKLAEERGVSSRVLWYGGYDWQSDEASEILFGSDAIVLPFDEGIALNNSSVAAAACHAKPLISVAGEKLEPAFRHGENVWLCPPRDAVALARGIETVLGQKELSFRLALGAQRLADDEFSWERACHRWAQVLRALRPRRVA